MFMIFLFYFGCFMIFHQDFRKLLNLSLWSIQFFGMIQVSDFRVVYCGATTDVGRPPAFRKSGSYRRRAGRYERATAAVAAR